MPAERAWSFRRVFRVDVAIDIVATTIAAVTPVTALPTANAVTMDRCAVLIEGPPSRSGSNVVATQVGDWPQMRVCWERLSGAGTYGGTYRC